MNKTHKDTALKAEIMSSINSGFWNGLQHCFIDIHVHFDSRRDFITYVAFIVVLVKLILNFINFFGIISYINVNCLVYKNVILTNVNVFLSLCLLIKIN